MDCSWVDDGFDGYGRSWHCDVCGKSVFYRAEAPVDCIKDSDAVVSPGWKPSGSAP